MLIKNLDYKIINYVLSKTKNGDNMAKFQLKNMQTEELNDCVIWSDFLDSLDPKVMRTGNVINVIDFEYNDKFNNNKIVNLTLVKEAKIGLSEEKRQSYFSKITDLINTFKNEKYKEVLLKVLYDNEELFKISSAAKAHHHSYVGGLVQHTFECIRYAKAIIPIIHVKIDKELVLAGCIAHDFGKMFEYITDEETGLTRVNEKFMDEWISHLHWGFSWANQNGLPELAHIIGSHHGLEEWGALVEPKTDEAKLMHQIDMLSSRFGKLTTDDLGE